MKERQLTDQIFQATLKTASNDQLTRALCTLSENVARLAVGTGVDEEGIDTERIALLAKQLVVCTLDKGQGAALPGRKPGDQLGQLINVFGHPKVHISGLSIKEQRLRKIERMLA